MRVFRCVGSLACHQTADATTKQEAELGSAPKRCAGLDLNQHVSSAQT